MSAGDWWTESWTPVVGCDMSLPCAAHCWARRWARRLSQMPQAAEKYAGMINERGEWTGVVRLDEKELLRPLPWRNPRVAAVSLMGDLFLAGDEVLDRLYAVMKSCPQHQFVALTKRAERRFHYSVDGETGYRVWKEREDILHGPDGSSPIWPLPNVIEMVSVSTQAELDERAPWLLKTPAVKRGLHIEPLLGAVDVEYWLYKTCRFYDPQIAVCDGANCPGRGIDWVVVGAETGPSARPMNPQWAADIRDQCRAAGVPFWFKGWGPWEPGSYDQNEWFYPQGHTLGRPGSRRLHKWDRGVGSDWIGPKGAGRLLGNREYNEVPW